MLLYQVITIILNILKSPLLELLLENTAHFLNICEDSKSFPFESGNNFRGVKNYLGHG